MGEEGLEMGGEPGPGRTPVCQYYIPAVRVELTISGMLAVHARHAVFTALSGVEGIVRAEVELGRAVVEHDGRVSDAALRAAVSAAGCEVDSLREMPRALPML
jgi:copper chaperone CopZ